MLHININIMVLLVVVVWRVIIGVMVGDRLHMLHSKQQR